MTVSSIGDINREIIYRANALNLGCDCGVDGAFGAEIAVVGEYVGEREKQTKMPLNGSGGKLFWDLVRPLGLTRRSVYITTAIKRQVVFTADGKTSINRHEADHYAGIIQWELQQLPNLKYIVCLGEHALEAVTSLSGIVHHRGSVYQTVVRSPDLSRNRECQVIAMLNPTDVASIKGRKNEIIMKFDVGRLMDVIQGKFKPHEVICNINPSFRDAMDWIRDLCRPRRPVALDIETISGETACIGLSTNAHEGYCINFRDQAGNRFTVEEETQIRLLLQQCADQQTQWVMQNGMFDSSWLAFKDRLMLGPAYFDTMLAHHTLYPSFPHNLGFITTQYTTHPYYKDEGKTWKEGGNIDQFWEYNCKDCAITYAAFEGMERELHTQGLWDFFISHVMRLQPKLIRMTVGGVLIDEGLKDTIARETREEVTRLKAEFQALAQEATGDAQLIVNPASPKQLADLFFTRLRLVGRGTATDVKNRARMRAHPRTPPIAIQMLDGLDKFAKENKFLGTYAEMRTDEDGRARCEYKQTGVASAPGRLSSAATMWDSGTNLQNQPSRAHKMFIADEGYEFNYFDLSQAEARVVGWHYDIETWIEQFEQARVDGIYDAHRALASEMFHIPYDEVPTYDFTDDHEMTIRYKAKRCRHGLNYRMGPDKLAETLGIPFGEAIDLWNIYHNVNPELKKGWDATVKKVESDRQLFNAYGRRWRLLERFDEEATKSVVAFYPQSTIGDKVSRCIYQCEDDPDWPVEHARMALNIHDALISLNKIEVGDTVRRIMKKYAEEPLSIVSVHTGKHRELIIPCDIKTSVPDADGIRRWSTLEKVKLAA
jgi:uracil-DNA glycosylase family 4